MLLQLALLAATGLAQRTCTVEHTANQDDSPAIRAALESCRTDATVLFRPGVAYNVWTQVATPRLSNVRIRVLGTLHLPADVPAVQAAVRARGAAWITVSGSRVAWEGGEGAAEGWVDSHGEAWWDANAAGGGTGLPNRPHLLAWKAQDGVLRRFKSRKPIAWNVGIGAERVLVEGAEIDAVAKPGRGFPFNTDGFGVTGKHVVIRRSRVFNGDDAVAVQDGARDVLVEDCQIGYQTHGLSIGSLGKNSKKAASVADIVFRNVSVDGGLYAARFKSWRGGQGLVSNVSWSDIRVQNVTVSGEATTMRGEADGAVPDLRHADVHEPGVRPPGSELEARRPRKREQQGHGADQDQGRH
jgi:polygalacturonase